MKKDIVEKGDLYADNLLEIANQTKASIEHGKRLHELDLDHEVIIGKAKMGVRTETPTTYVDRLIDMVSQSKVGKFVNEYTLASAISIAYCIWAKINKDITDNKLLAAGTIGATAILSSFTAGIKEYRIIREKRKQFFREIAKGKKFQPEEMSSMEKDLDEYKFEAKNASDLLKDLENSLYSNTKDKTIKGNFSFEEFQLAINALAEIESRIEISDSQKIDLINYSDVLKVEQERATLDSARIRAKIELRKIFKGNKDSFQNQDVGNFDEYLRKISETITLELIDGDNGVEKKNALFNKMKQQKVVSAAIGGLFGGLVVGTVAQEISNIVKDNLKPVEYLTKLLKGESVVKYAIAGIGVTGSVLSDAGYAEVSDFTKEKFSDKIRENKNETN